MLVGIPPAFGSAERNGATAVLIAEALTGPLRFTPVERTFRFEGKASLGAMLAGTVGLLW
jgi:hypothetical protein